MRFHWLRWPRWSGLHRIDGHAITCREVVGLVTAYLDGALPRDDHELFEAHLSECEDCTEHVQQIRATVALTGQVRDEDLDPQAREDLTNLYRRWLAESDA